MVLGTAMEVVGVDREPVMDQALVLVLVLDLDLDLDPILVMGQVAEMVAEWVSELEWAREAGTTGIRAGDALVATHLFRDLLACLGPIILIVESLTSQHHHHHHHFLVCLGLCLELATFLAILCRRGMAYPLVQRCMKIIHPTLKMASPEDRLTRSPTMRRLTHQRSVRGSVVHMLNSEVPSMQPSEKYRLYYNKGP